MRRTVDQNDKASSADIIKGCRSIYGRFEIPRYLRGHMVRVAGLASLGL